MIGTETLYRRSIDFAALEITPDCVARSMGYTDGAIPAPFSKDIEQLIAEAEEYVKIEAGFQVFPPESVRIEPDCFSIAKTHFATGRIIALPLRKADTLALFALTAGPGFTVRTQFLMNNDQQLQGYFVDALGSVTAERAADWIEEEIVQWAKAHGLATTNRYSPGYCQWSVAEQHKLFGLLPEGFCGITLTDSALMRPTKSVSGVIGIGRKVKKQDYACSICDLENCFRRNTRYM